MIHCLIEHCVHDVQRHEFFVMIVGSNRQLGITTSMWERHLMLGNERKAII